VGSKYLFVINSFLAGGAERSLLELLPLIRDQGITSIVACLERQDVGFESEVRDAGFDVRLLPGRGFLGKTLALRRLIKAEQPGLVYSSLFDADLAARLAAIGIRVPVMTNLANTAYDAARLLDPNVSPMRLRIVQMIDGFTARHLTDHFHAISQAVKESTVVNLGVDPERITVVKRGRDAARLGEPTPQRRQAMRARLGLTERDEVVVTVGRQEFQKGHRHLLDAFAKVIEARPHALLLIAGREGHASRDLEARIVQLGLEERVTLLGHRDDVADVLAASDLFVFPSLYEGLGGALIEAIALGLPIIASDIPALREVVRQGENADLVGPGDAKGLALAILRLLNDQGLRQRYGERSRQLFESEFRAEIAVQRLSKLLEKVALKPVSGESAQQTQQPHGPGHHDGNGGDG
jgi:glycosyltransferase involved in cell wall biosynthesis